MSSRQNLPSSFRDPSGFMFEEDGVLFRQVNSCYKEEYDKLIASGLYRQLTESGLLLRHEEANGSSLESKSDGESKTGDSQDEHGTATFYKLLRPERVPFISYPYEWCFSQMKEAALLTLAIQKQALEHGMSLKDASAYNVQFVRGAPVFIDTLSFETYKEGQPWVAYKQFCQHFAAPLALMAQVDLKLAGLLQTNIDGIPLELAANLLPKSTLLNLPLLMHVHLHAKSQKKYSKSEAPEAVSQGKLSRMSLLGIIDNLESLVKGLRLKNQETFWKDYYKEHNYSDTAFKSKHSSVEEFITATSPQKVIDLGANTGLFSRIASQKGLFTLSTDMDALTVEANYLKAKEDKDENLMPLVIDLSVPSPAIGWANQERMAFAERGRFDLAMALALIHHLAIGNNIPFASVADYFGRIAKHLIIEFVPKSDSQVKEMLSLREDIFPHYAEPQFEQAFESVFTIERKVPVADSTRTLYLMKKRAG